MSYAVALRSGPRPLFDPVYRYLSLEKTLAAAVVIAEAANGIPSPSRAVVLAVVPPGDVGAGEYVTLVTDAGENIVCRL